jgi:hypothetical protein
MLNRNVLLTTIIHPEMQNHIAISHHSEENLSQNSVYKGFVIMFLLINYLIFLVQEK